MNDPAKEFQEVVKFHGHACPGLAFGFRVTRLALRELGIDRAADEELVAVVENNSCAVDAIQAMAGCTFGKGNLIFNDYGKQVYTFIRRSTGEAVRLAVNWQPSPESPEIEEAWEKFSGDGEFYHVQGIMKQIAERKVVVKPLTGKRVDTGAPDGYLRALVHYVSKQPDLLKVLKEEMAELE